jgi:imidazolonepropionase-like amidohydrolase
MLVLRVARVFDGRAAAPRAGVVFVDGGRVAGVEPAGFEIPSGCTVIDRPTGTLLPGLIDAHVHLVCDAAPGALDAVADRSPEQLSATIGQSLRAHLSAGVTTVRDLGDRDWAVLDWRRRRPPGLPTVLASGPPITSPGGHCWAMGGAVSGLAELRAAVRERVSRGADVVKIMASGGVMTAGTAVDRGQFHRDELAAVVAESHAAGLPVTAHAHAVTAIRGGVEAGADGIEHCTFLTADSVQVPADLVAALAARGTAVCPTLGRVPGTTPPRQLVDRLVRAGLSYAALPRQVLALHRAGVAVISGSDGGISPGKPHGLLPKAISELVGAGMPAADALATATSAAAAACGVGDRKGLIRPGYDADLIVVDGDPLTDVDALRRLDTVVLSGRVVSPVPRGAGP